MEFIITSKKEISENIDLLLSETKSFNFETWDKENFLLDLPCKWELSVVAKNYGEILGFSFNSQKGQAMHIHFFYVFQTQRNNQTGLLMLKKCIRLAQGYKLSKITLKCNIGNYRALKFYVKNDFDIESLEGKFYHLYKNINLK